MWFLLCVSRVQSKAPHRHHPAVETNHVVAEKAKKEYNVKVAIEEVNGVLYRKTPPASVRPPPMVVHAHEDFAHHEEAVVSDSIFRQAVGTTLRSVSGMVREGNGLMGPAATRSMIPLLDG